MGGWEHGFASFWWILPVFIFVLIIACIFMMRGCFCMFGRRNVRRLSDNSAEEILNKRYALGEIDRKEYEEVKAGIISKEERPDG